MMIFAWFNAGAVMTQVAVMAVQRFVDVSPLSCLLFPVAGGVAAAAAIKFLETR
ncbi:hypothetical protein [Rhizobium leguminosarum]|uniref:hypothetical protein n=1 Tax=Rhizobium leguminosarum TaxID=384 RepID=UPI002E0DBAE0|nr:hypothetical protein U8Q02_43145 [Rhizobium leguminosarum]